jgi:hypothetical protein
VQQMTHVYCVMHAIVLVITLAMRSTSTMHTLEVSEVSHSPIHQLDSCIVLYKN